MSVTEVTEVLLNTAQINGNQSALLLLHYAHKPTIDQKTIKALCDTF